MKITFIKAKDLEFSIEKHEVYTEGGFVKIKRKIEPRFEAFVAKDFNDIMLEDLVWLDEVEEVKEKKYIKNALAYLHSYYRLPKRES